MRADLRGISFLPSSCDPNRYRDQARLESSSARAMKPSSGTTFSKDLPHNWLYYLSCAILSSLIIVAMLLAGCEDFGTGPGPVPPIDQDLYVSLDGGNNNAGLWVLDANTLELIDSLGTGRGVPFSIEFSPDQRWLYSIWQEYPSRETYLSCVDIIEMSVVQRTLVNPSRPYLSTSADHAMLIAHGGAAMAFFDRATLGPLREDTSSYLVWQVKPSSNERKLVFTRSSMTMFEGLAVFDVDSFRIQRTIPLADSSAQQKMEPADLAISPNGKYAFVSVFNWRGLGGYNSLFVVDMVGNRIVGEMQTGAFAQLGMSPDGSSVYVSDPAGYLYSMPATNRILRYDAPTNSLQVFVTLSDLGLTGSSLITDKIVVASDNRTVFVTVGGDVKDAKGQHVSILKIDAFTRRILETFSLPVDGYGNTTQTIRNITLGPSRD